MNELLQLLLAYGVALLITLLIIPNWIMLCSKWHLFEKPNVRKHHLNIVPSMGGMAIFCATLISFLIFGTGKDSGEVKYIVAASTALFFTGFFDDLMDVDTLKKLVIQIITALVIVIAGGIKIESLHGIFGIGTLPLAMQYALSVFLILFITNAFNFIDGIDGLAATLGLIIISLFGMIFYLKQDFIYASLCFALIGALTGFLLYNFDPAKIFMGDTGSLVTGFLIALLSVKIFSTFTSAESINIINSPALIIGSLFILVFDLSRVIFIRTLNGTSPFKADRSHLHHMILRQNFGHRGATIILASFNILFILLAFVFKEMNAGWFLILCYCIAIFLINSKVISLLAQLRNKLIGEPKRSIEMNDLV
jgi:UDP-N-acetylmuramyl pentapeptide phosphotransferase/UDP-N-acetylglucosamine-1-phosphate transferase